MLHSVFNPKVQENNMNYLSLSSIYAHGQLQDRLNYDILCTDNINVFNQVFNLHWPENEHVIETQAVDDDNNEYPVTMYLWKTPSRKMGLVVLKGDKRSEADAQAKMKEKKTHI